MNEIKSKSETYIGGQKDLLKKNKGAYTKYKELFLGEVSIFYLIKYEIIVYFFSWLPGSLGFLLRKIFYPTLFKKSGKGVVFGRNMTLRHAKKIEIGDNVIFDDNTVIDAKGENNNGIIIGDSVLVGRNSSISCKGGNIEIGDYSNIGPNNIIISESDITIGNYVFTAGQIYMIAGGNHSFDRIDIPIWHRPSVSKGGITIENDIWIGASVTVLDGVHIGKGAVIGAASLVNKDIDAYTINAGVPTKVIKKRK